jgi:DnaK suppressor protein
MTNKEILEAKLLEFQQLLPSKEELQIEHFAEELDQIQAQQTREIVAQAGSYASVQIARVQEALGRVANGVYGVCEECGEGISQRRLEALPWAELCVTCQEILEEG